MQEQTAQGIVKGNVLYRLAGVSFIVGAILAGVLAALEPGAADPSNVAEVLTEAADNETLWKVIFLGIAVGMWAIMMGVVGVTALSPPGAPQTGRAWASTESLWEPPCLPLPMQWG